MSRVLSNQKQLAVQDGPKKWKTPRLPEPWGKGKQASWPGCSPQHCRQQASPRSWSHSTARTPCSLLCQGGDGTCPGPRCSRGKERVRAASASSIGYGTRQGPHASPAPASRIPPARTLPRALKWAPKSLRCGHLGEGTACEPEVQRRDPQTPAPILQQMHTPGWRRSGPPTPGLLRQTPSASAAPTLPLHRLDGSG